MVSVLVGMDFPFGCSVMRSVLFCSVLGRELLQQRLSFQLVLLLTMIVLDVCQYFMDYSTSATSSAPVR
jgi:hypothetical protein